MKRFTQIGCLLLSVSVLIIGLLASAAHAPTIPAWAEVRRYTNSWE
jgi:hypothetical protein